MSLKEYPLGQEHTGSVTQTVCWAQSLHNFLIFLQTAGKKKSPGFVRDELEKSPRYIKENDPFASFNWRGREKNSSHMCLVSSHNWIICTNLNTA